MRYSTERDAQEKFVGIYGEIEKTYGGKKKD
jgi:hypothetical protein